MLNSILLAVLLTVTVVPAFDTLRRRGVPKGLAVVLTSLLLVTVLVALLGLLGLSGTRLLQVLPHYQDRAQALQRSLEGMLVARGIEPERVLSLDLVDPNRVLGLAAGFLSGLGKVLSQALLLILCVIVILDSFFHDPAIPKSDNEFGWIRDLYNMTATDSVVGDLFRTRLIPGFVTIFGLLIPTDIRAIYVSVNVS